MGILRQTLVVTKTSTGGSIVEFSPATREARVRFQCRASLCLFYFPDLFFRQTKSPLVTSERALSDVQALVVQW